MESSITTPALFRRLETRFERRRVATKAEDDGKDEVPPWERLGDKPKGRIDFLQLPAHDPTFGTKKATSQKSNTKSVELSRKGESEERWNRVYS